MSSKFKIAALSFTVALALGGVVALLWLLGSTPSARADSPHRVAPNCTGIPAPCHTSVQAAVDAASPGDVILVAAGVYTDVHGRPAPPGYPHPPASGVVTQVVYINKTVTIRGGYTTAFTDPPDPETNQTTLDARGQGRVILIAGYISPTIEGLRITRGDAVALGGDPWWEWGVGSGMYVITATATINNNWVFSNTIAWRGGGLYLFFSDSTLGENTIMSNTAGSGGGLYLYDSAATLSDNTVISNTARVGGGLYLWRSATTLSGNTVMSNTADRGGGLYLYDSAAMLSDNTVISNTALTYSGDYEDGGGGLYLYNSAATLSGNTISTNFAWWNGGGLYLYNSAAMLSGNTVISNIAVFGGGLYLGDSAATLSGNTVMSNTAGDGGGLYLIGSDATLSGNAVMFNTAGSGGGLYVFGDVTLSGNTVMSNTADRGGGLLLALSDITLSNTVIADNQAGREGSGLYIVASSPHLLHTTIARNTGGDGSGLYVIGEEGWAPDYFSTVALTNTILVSHSVGISVTGGNTVTVNSILWYGTPITVSQATTAIVTVQDQYQGDPLFAADGYHLTSASTAAIDKGVDAGVTTDIDGDSRDSAPDLGADEFASSPGGNQLYLPIIMKGY